MIPSSDTGVQKDKNESITSFIGQHLIYSLDDITYVHFLGVWSVKIYRRKIQRQAVALVYSIFIRTKVLECITLSEPQ